MPHSSSSRPESRQRVDVDVPLGFEHQLASLFGGVVDDDDDCPTEDLFDPHSIHSSDNSDAELSSDYGSINTVVEAYTDLLDDQDAVQNHREAFYRMYLPVYHKVKAGTNLINDAKYEELVKLLSNPLPKGASMTDRNNRRKYELVGNIAGHCLYRNGLVVTTVEKVFDVILEAHIRLNHARSSFKNKECIKKQLGYYGVPKTAVKCFVETCSVVSSAALHNGTGYFIIICSNITLHFCSSVLQT